MPIFFPDGFWRQSVLQAMLVVGMVASTGCIMAAPALHQKQLRAEAREEKMWDLREEQRQKQRQAQKHEQNTQTQKPLKASDF